MLPSIFRLCALAGYPCLRHRRHTQTPIVYEQKPHHRHLSMYLRLVRGRLISYQESWGGTSIQDLHR